MQPFEPAFLVLLGLMATAAWLDVMQRRLPNWLCLAVVLAGGVATTMLGGAGGLLSAAIHLVIALVVGMGLFRLGMVGGGDAKFYAATALWFGLAEAVRLLMSVTILGVVLLGAFIIFNRLSRAVKKGQERAQGDFAKLPYGVAIAAGALVAKSGLY
jgi:prepilin peptidase CpaA